MAILWEQLRNTTAEVPKAFATPFAAKPAITKLPPRPKRKVRARTKHVVDRVIDGETLLTRKGEYLNLARVESPPCDSGPGLAAKSWLKAFCSPGVVVSFERKRTDKEGRTVAEVFLLGRCINDLIIKHAPVRRVPEPPHHLRPATKRAEKGTATITSEKPRRIVTLPLRQPKK